MDKIIKDSSIYGINRIPKVEPGTVIAPEVIEGPWEVVWNFDSMRSLEWSLPPGEIRGYFLSQNVFTEDFIDEKIFYYHAWLYNQKKSNLK